MIETVRLSPYLDYAIGDYASRPWHVINWQVGTFASAWPRGDVFVGSFATGMNRRYLSRVKGTFAEGQRRRP